MQDQLLNLFFEIVKIDSPSGEEEETSRFVIKYLKALGLKPEVDEYNMIYCRVGKGENPRLFCAHMDTVNPGRGIEPIIKNDFIVSKSNTILGADNKSSVAAILLAVKNILESGEVPNIELLFSVREETDCGISQFNYSKLESKVGYVFDSGDGDLSRIVVGGPTIQDFKHTIIGQSAHASRPEDAKNALIALMSLKDKITLGRVDENSTLNIGLVQGGDATNTIPGSIRIEGDLRSNSHETFEKIKAQFNSALEAVAADINGSIDYNWIPYSFAYELDQNTAEYSRVKQIYSKNGIELSPERTTGGSDAGFLNHVGIETFCLGYSSINPHRLDEKVRVDTFIKQYDMTVALMRSCVSLY